MAEKLEKRQHRSYKSRLNHYAFSFPENEQLDNHWMAMFKDMNFELGIMGTVGP